MSDSSSEKQQKILNFDPDGVGNTHAGIFGLPFHVEESEVVIIPVPWDVTVSNNDGTSRGPENILRQSPQIDLYDEFVEDPWKAGIAMETIPEDWVEQNKLLREKASKYIEMLEMQPDMQNELSMSAIREEVNAGCADLCRKVKEKSALHLHHNKLVVLVGGDHSTPLGLIQALAEHHKEMGILQIDAHADLRPAYMGFTHSHASIMHNASSLNQIKSIVQVGLRDVCEQEATLMNSFSQRYFPFYARNINRQLYEGTPWKNICENIIRHLPEKVYITFDIDGLDPSQCPTTGTPVPGGLDYSQVLYLFEELVLSGRKIVGFDLVETGDGETDGIIACRILYKTIALMLKTHNRI